MITSGGLGPTHDDRTVEAVAEVAGAELEVDEELLATIAAITAGYARRRGTDPALNRDGDRKQALVPRGATVIPPAGTAPGLLLPLGGGHLLVLPGPPRELAEVWRAALELAPIAALRARAGTLLRHTLRVYGVGEPAVARAFAAAGGDAGGTRTTICARLLEVEVTVRAEPESGAALTALVAGLREQLGDAVYAEDERAARRARARPPARARPAASRSPSRAPRGSWRARLADIPGSSDVLLGGVIAYANDVKERLLGVPAEVIAEFGAVSAECARGDGRGRARRDGAEVGDRRHRRRGPGRRQRAQAGRARVPARLGSRCRARAGAAPARRPLSGARAERDRGAAARTDHGFVTPRAVAAYPGR